MSPSTVDDTNPPEQVDVPYQMVAANNKAFKTKDKQMNKSGKMIRGESSYSGGLESYLDVAAILVLCFGGIHFLVSLLSLHWVGLITSIYIAFGAFLGWLLLRAIAELIRLQKKIAGVPFSGAITVGTEHIHYSCGACGKPFYGNVEVRCEYCGADLQADDSGNDNTGSEG